MCIVCNNHELGLVYLDNMANAVNSLKECEKVLLAMSDIKNIKFEPSDEKAKLYNKAHKKLVRTRKKLGIIEQTREVK